MSKEMTPEENAVHYKLVIELLNAMNEWIELQTQVIKRAKIMENYMTSTLMKDLDNDGGKHLNNVMLNFCEDLKRLDKVRLRFAAALREQQAYVETLTGVQP
jgi:hypothetical protein